jgi:hypothetical protein
MSNFNWTPLSQSAYDAQLFQIIVNAEESGKPNPLVYLDSKGIPTIGIGFNLRDDTIRNKVADSILGTSNPSQDFIYRNMIRDEVAKTWASPTALQNSLNAIMAQRAADSSINIPNKGNYPLIARIT